MLDGSIIADINTRGTNHMLLRNKKFYIISEKGGLLEYDTASKISNLFELPDKIKLNYDTEFLTQDSKLFAIAYKKPPKDKNPHQFYSVCIQLD